MLLQEEEIKYNIAAAIFIIIITIIIILIETVQFHTSSTQTWKRGDSRAMEMSQRYRR